MKRKTIDCQQCGDEIYELNNAEAQKVAADPYNYIIYCRVCKRDMFKESQFIN